MAQKGLIKQDLSKELVRGKQAAFQYKPIESKDLSWLSQTENKRKFAESERKAKEQRDLRDNLAKIEALGLPKEMQGYLNSNVEDLINKVRNGEIDPESYDFRRMVQTISGEANQLNNINNNLKTLAAEDKQVIIDGRDVSGDYKNQYFSAFNKDYVPGTNVYDKYAGLQTNLQRGTKEIEFDDTTANNLLNDYIERNVNKNASISKLKQDGFSGYNLIKELATLDQTAAQNWVDYLNTQSQTSLISEYAKAEKTANAAGIPIEPYEEWKMDRLKNFIPNLRQNTSADIEADPYAVLTAKEKAEGGVDLSDVFSNPVEYNLEENEGNPIKTYATTLNLKTETNLDYTDPVSSEEKFGQPSKINRLYFDPSTNEYIIGFNRYINSEDVNLKDLPDNTIFNYIEGEGKNKFYLDKSEEILTRTNEDDLNFDALVSSIAKETKTTKRDVLARLLRLKQVAQESQIGIPESVAATVNGKKIRVDTSGTVTNNGNQYTYPEILKIFKGNVGKAVNYWNNHTDQSAEGNKARAAQQVPQEVPVPQEVTFNADGSMNSITKPSDQSKNPTTTPKKKNNTQSSDTPNVDGEEVPSTATAEMRILKYKNKAGKEITFEEDSKDFLTNIEVNYGGLDQDNGTTKGLPSYGNKSDTRIDDHLNSTKPLGKYFDGTLKKGLKADIGEDVYNSLSDAQKALLRMEHLNVGWNPKVLILLNAGIIDEKDRGKYHNPQKTQNPEKWDINKLYEEKKGAVLKFINQNQSGEIMADHLEKIYKGTDNSLAKNTDKQNELRNKGFQEQYEKRMKDIRERYSIY